MSARKQKKKNPKKIVRKNFRLWSESIKTGDVDFLVKVYGKKPNLHATFEEHVKTRKGIRKYFTKFSATKPKAKILKKSEKARWLGKGKVCLKHTGTYVIRTIHGKIRARFVFIWEVTKKGNWKLIYHNSSESPSKES